MSKSHYQYNTGTNSTSGDSYVGCEFDHEDSKDFSNEEEGTSSQASSTMQHEDSKYFSDEEEGTSSQASSTMQHEDSKDFSNEEGTSSQASSTMQHSHIQISFASLEMNEETNPVATIPCDSEYLTESSDLILSTYMICGKTVRSSAGHFLSVRAVVEGSKITVLQRQRLIALSHIHVSAAYRSRIYENVDTPRSEPYFARETYVPRTCDVLLRSYGVSVTYLYSYGISLSYVRCINAYVLRTYDVCMAHEVYA